MPHTSSGSEVLATLLSPSVVDAILERLPRLTSDADAALTNGERWVEAYINEQGAAPAVLGHLDWLLPVWASGAFLPRLMVRRPWLFDSLANAGELPKRRPWEAFRDEILMRTAPLRDAAAVAGTLRNFKTEQIFSIGARDLAGRMDLLDVTWELSSLASACVEAAYRFHRAELVRQFGEPLTAAGSPAGFVVLGMGKLGGWELNFSSDIDLIYLYEEQGQTAGGEAGSTANVDFFSRLAKKITSAIHDVTEDGFVFRVDLRLRPEGNYGPIVNSLVAAESYYANWGQTWERAAMLKARPVAGDIELGDEFLASLTGVIYRRYLDYGTVEDIKLMKQKIDANLSRNVHGAWDVKLGRGGIREIEFVVQTLQLIHAGKQKQLRTRQTLEALSLLDELELIDPEDAVALARAYDFHRRLEHRLQIEHERQTQRLSDEDRAHRRMARLMGYDDEDPDAALARFRQDLGIHRDAVQDVYRRLFEEPEKEISEGVNPRILAVTEGEGNDEERIAALRELGFDDPENALEIMRRLAGARYVRRLDTKGRRYFERIMPLFLSECAASPSPDLALAHLEDFMGRVGGFSAYHSLLAENPATLKLLVRLFGMSPFLSKFFIRHPELLDQLVLSSYAMPVKSAATMRAELEAALSETEPEDEEAQLDILRRFKNTEMLRVAMNDVEGELDLIEVTTQLADLGDVVLRAAIRIARALIERRHGVIPGSQLVVLGMGKFGGREMNYSSDLDLIFIYQGEGESSGERSLGVGQYYAKVVQRLISTLTLATREGVAYPIDTRLRPSGNQGALVTTMAGFENYHHSVAAIWERQALIKARPIVGDEESAVHVTEVLHHAVYERPLTDEQVSEILRVRHRMEKEIDPENDSRYNIKTGRGGIVDIEFLVQILQLRHGGEYHTLRTPNTFAALGELHDLGLLGNDDYQMLRDAFLFLRRLENRMRVLQDSARSNLPKDPGAVERLALSMGYGRGASRGEAGALLLKEFARVRENVREIFLKHFENH